ncbi:MAG: decaprenyl-phosphate phosphoribosyltransferase [bacterium]
MDAVKALLISMRPRQWSKNLFVLAGVIFSRSLFDLHLLLLSVFAFILFCLLSSSVYLFNDVTDYKEDSGHPTKSKRPIASGALSRAAALLFAGIFALVGLALSFLISPRFGIAAASYVGLMFSYSVLLKRAMIVDVLAISAGFVLRAAAGALAIDVEISSWLLICTGLLALFLGFSKRRHELVVLEQQASEHRSVLSGYSPRVLDQMIAVVTASTVMAYALYTVSAETVAKFGTRLLGLTIPFVLYGIFRYLYLVHIKGEGGSPERSLLQDKPFLIDIILWVTVSGLILYLT